MQPSVAYPEGCLIARLRGNVEVESALKERRASTRYIASPRQDLFAPTNGHRDAADQTWTHSQPRFPRVSSALSGFLLSCLWGFCRPNVQGMNVSGVLLCDAVSCCGVLLGCFSIVCLLYRVVIRTVCLFHDLFCVSSVWIKQSATFPCTVM